ncbi:histidine phosphatase family protein [Kribbella sp. NPDC051770]|uniref:histidine phosphatase family protein n=1 Tax=Kribbella sp. NPDC051770 TaxID=3155413 RepID=UPI003423094A
MPSTRYLYLTRHAEAHPDESTLTTAGRQQATLLGQRLRDVPLTTIHHSPLPRATETADLIADALPDVRLHPTIVAGDYIPYVPQRDELPPTSADTFLDFLAQSTPEDHRLGALLAPQALTHFTGPTPGAAPVHELVITHNFLIAWLVRDALDAPPWRWLTLNHCNAALTVIRYTPDRPASVLLYNDMQHLPTTLQWTGFPPDLLFHA